MSERTAVRLAWGLGAVCLVGYLLSVALLVADHAAMDSTADSQVVWLVNGAVCAALGVLIVTRRPRNPIGWLLLIEGTIGAVFNIPEAFVAMRGLLAGAGVHGWVAWVTWTFNASSGLGAVILLVTVMFFPDGRLPSRRWRWALVVAGAGSVLFVAGAMFTPTPVQISGLLPSVPNPLGVGSPGGFLDTNGPGATALTSMLLLIVVAAVVVKFRRSSGVERRQIRWFAAVVVTGIGLGLLSFAASPLNSSAAGTAGSVCFDLFVGVAMPLTIGLAVMRHGLYDLDVIISRAIVYGLLAVFITSVYVAIAVGFGALVGSSNHQNLGLSILATAIVAIGFQPVRERMQKLANRLVYGRRATPYEVLAEFSEQVAQSYAMDDVMPRMARVLAEGTGAQRADVWLAGGGTLRCVASWPADAAPLRRGLDDADHAVEVRHRGEVLGALSVVKQPGESLSGVEQSLLAHLAHQAGLVMRNVGLTADLQQRLEELRASRQRLVAAQDEERRRIERNLHDGAQQHLVALRVKLGLVEMLLGKDVERARAAVEQLKADAAETLETVRDLARGIYPPLLADQGLAAALRAHAGKATVPVEVRAETVARYPADVEGAVYFCVLEALQNVQKYAGASTATVSLYERDGALHFEVCDDGRGFDVATARRGAGLTNMADRVDALGGVFDVDSQPGHGSRLHGAIPVRVAQPAAVPVEAMATA